MKKVQVSALALAALLDYFHSCDDLPFAFTDYLYELEDDFCNYVRLSRSDRNKKCSHN